MRVHGLALAVVLAIGSPPVDPDTGLPAIEEPADQDEALVIEWDAPTVCPDGAELRRRIDELLGGPPTAAQGRVVVSGEVRGPEPAWSLRLRIANEAGERVRELPGTSCDELTGIAAVLIAVALDRSDEPEPTEPATPPPAATPTTKRQPAPSSPAARPRRFGAALGVHGGVSWGPLPRIAGGVAADVALLIPHARVEVGGAFWFPRDTGSHAIGDGSVQLWQVDARGCGVPSWRRIELLLCAGVQAGAMSGRGRGADHPRTGRLPWLAIEVRPGAVFQPIPRLGLRLDAALVVPVIRPGFAIDDAVVFRARVAGFVGSLGVEVRLP